MLSLLISYIDPGTGSMLFSLALAAVSVVWFGLRKLYFKLKYLTFGKRMRTDGERLDVAIYSEDKRYWTSFKDVCDEFELRGIRVAYLAGTEDDPILSERYRYVETEVIGLGNRAYARLNLLEARVCLATTPGLDVYQWKRSKTVDHYVHMTHSLGGGTAYRMFGTEFFDAVLLCSDIFVPLHRELERKRGSKPKDIRVVGQTYMDYLMRRREQEAAMPHEGTTVLLAPSWGPNGLLTRYGSRILDELVQSGFDVTVRPHPQSFVVEGDLIEGLMGDYPESERFHWNRDADNFDVLSASDVLISDFSGVIYDYAFIFERPVIYAGANPDTSVQDEAWLDEPYWGTAVLPDIGVELTDADLPRLGEIVSNLVCDEGYRQSICKARDTYWQNRGHAASAVVDYVVECIQGTETNDGRVSDASDNSGGGNG